ncbi:MAG: hypothetical protein EA365_08070 [Gloeocapsa sp. DLM2.Bin57]|nr:MAG: hypothetical protein EA365_08070 [Gloeocapsa sp. DLM2.Bin57]
MFLQELNPIFQEFIKQPVPFVNGLIAGALRLNLAEDPLKSWLEKQGLTQVNTSQDNDNGNKPEYISIN